MNKFQISFFSRSIRLPALLASLIALTTACSQGKTIKGEGEAINDSRATSAFSEVSIALASDVKWVLGETHNVQVTAQANLQPHILTEVKGKSLKIYSKNNLQPRGDIQIIITAPALYEVSIAGSASFSADSPLKGKDISLKIAGSGKIHAPIEAEELEVKISGAGEMTLRGTSEESEFKIAGSGVITANDLVVTDAEVSIAGSGEITLQATKSLNGKIAGSGEIKHSGAAEPTIKIAGSGSARRL